MSEGPPSFVAIDFETANRSPRSAVAVGLVRVDRGEVAAEVVEFIRPTTKRFENTSVHGIGPLDVIDADEFGEVWSRIGRWVDGARFIAAHNAEFDREVLMACCEKAERPTPRLPFVCTMALARAVWELRPTRLPDVCRRLGIPLQHHEPGSDALACARIVLAAWGTELGRRKVERMVGGRGRRA
ncbi:3'-5' exonuclease [Paraliomyxa miuraensis]|uniref:3'-5' exonuclease n=1 Tax=Paraliomyxa miuraensis TaxID=376150 RepID=UPI00224E379F|nr:3'-5' exonuclease [Paraliomyxa miuraensis]MCX4244412.1 3'-5' exonuclease [Paraliomyxa miuraensis]